MTEIYITIVLVIILMIIVRMRNVYDDYMYGFWVADNDDFCEKSGIESMMIFIGLPERGWINTTRTCYIIIMDDLCNQGFTITYRLPLYCTTIYTLNAGVDFDDEKIWPDTVKIQIDMHAGTMKIFDDSTLFAKLVKHHDTTNMVRRLESAEFVG
jgi:hypothetical protein